MQNAYGAMRDPSSQPPFGFWRHRKGSLYEILGFGIQENNLVPVVIYREIKGETIWTRPCKEFFDGRFTRETK